jgi:signal transduction histidine kinase
MIATAVIMAFAFGAIYLAVAETLVRNLDADLSFEAQKHTSEIKIIEDSIAFINKAELEEREHTEVQVNPVFIQLLNKSGRVLDKSPNLKEDYLEFNESKFGGHFDSEIGNRSIRQVQLPIEQEGRIVGYIIAAMSSESIKSTVLMLRNVLLISYLSVLFGLYFISKILAGRSISPVQDVTTTITHITQDNLKERVELPRHKDEIYALSAGFNSLLDRIENALEREKQFTSDASHELRTPLATLRGTLEVLIRKPRNQEEYEAKIRYSLSEIEKMTETLEQLLLLARLDTQASAKQKTFISLPTIIDESLSHLKDQIAHKKLRVVFKFDENRELKVPHYYTNLIIDNIIGNAVKYAREGSVLKIAAAQVDDRVQCTVEDEGIGIKEEDLEHVFKNFYRSEAPDQKRTKGNGLGLSIAAKAAEAINAEIKIDSTLNRGTTATITF